MNSFPPPRIIFLDLNSYFASVEQAEHQELVGKAVAVVPVLADTTSCLAASYPAKACGVRTGTSVREARRLCPGIIFVEANHRKYVDYHHRIVRAVENCLPVWKICSIDEMAIRLYGREQTLEFALAKSREIKERIMREVHPALTCSIGIAPNRYLAKIASDMQKPNGLVVIGGDQLPQCLFKLQLRDFPGIGPRMEERLFAARCGSAKALCTKSLAELHALWGSKVGDDFWRLIRGEELEERETKRASINHSRVLSPKDRNSSSAWSHLVALTSKAAMRLREENFFARSLQLSLKLLARELADQYFDQRAKFLETQDTSILLAKLAELWQQAPQDRILRVSITLAGLVPGNKHQTSIFEDQKQSKLMFALDKLNKAHRKNLVVIASSSELKRLSHAPIAFSHIPSSAE